LVVCTGAFVVRTGALVERTGPFVPSANEPETSDKDNAMMKTNLFKQYGSVAKSCGQTHSLPQFQPSGKQFLGSVLWVIG
jgi:hypothetical protein